MSGWSAFWLYLYFFTVPLFTVIIIITALVSMQLRA